MRIYRGQAGVIFPNGKLSSLPYKLGKQRPTGPKSFSTNRSIATRFARGIAGHYGAGYVPVLIIAEVNAVRKTSNYDLEKEVIPIGIVNVISMKVLSK
jgi:hypothetical protein